MPETADTQVMEHTAVERIDELVNRADELMRLTMDGRTIFTGTEMIDFALDVRMALLAAREQLLPAALAN